MPAFIKSVTFDCADALRLARFWAETLGSNVDEDATTGKAYVEAAGWGSPNMWFNAVPAQDREESHASRSPCTRFLGG